MARGGKSRRDEGWGKRREGIPTTTILSCCPHKKRKVDAMTVESGISRRKSMEFLLEECFAVCGSVWQCVAACCSVLRRVAVCVAVRQWRATGEGRWFLCYENSHTSDVL